MPGTVNEPKNWDLVPPASPGYKWIYCCTVYDSSSGCHESVCDCAAWSASYPAQWVTNLAPEGNSTCNGCSISSSVAHPQVRWNECTPDPDQEEWYDRSTFSECYELVACTDPDVPFPPEEEGYSYGEPFHEYDANYADKVEACALAKGRLQNAYLSCYNWYRCQTRPGYEWDGDDWVKCGDSFEILKNVEFASLVSGTEATEWDSTEVIFNSTSLSDHVGNVAHFGDSVCEILSQPITTDNDEYRYNPTMLYGIQISYIDIRNARSDSTLVINVGGDVDVYDLERIRNKFPLGNSGVTDVYAFQTGEEIFTIEKPVTSVNPGLYAVAEIWQFGDIILEVAKYGITGYIPCEKILTDEDAIVSGLSCAEDDDITEYLWKQDLYRRKIVTFDTDIQGLVPQYLDKILISHSALQWGEAGEVVSLVGDDGILLSDELVDTVSSKTIVFRNIDGSISGAYGAIVTDGYNIEVYGKPDWVKEKTLYTIQDINSAQEFLVTSVVPNGNIVKIECVEYVEEIYK